MKADQSQIMRFGSLSGVYSQGRLANQIAVVVVVLMAIGTVFVCSAGVSVSQEFEIRSFYNFQAFRQMLFFPLAIVVMYAVSSIDYHRLSLAGRWSRSATVYLLGAAIILLVLVLLPQFGMEINRARRWLRIPAGPLSISFQPSELAKWAVVFFLAGWCDRFAGSLHLYRRRFVPVCLIVAVVAGLIVVEDFGTAAMVAGLSFLILLIAGTPIWHLATPVPFAAAGFLAAIVTSPHRLQRLAAFVNPERLASTAAYQATQSLIALGSGGLWGKGLGRGVCKYGHLPEDTSDFIFAIIGEELGFVGTLAVIILFMLFVWLGVIVVVRSRDRFGQLLAAGIVLTIAVQAAINIGVVTVVLPTKGIALPFVSAGGTGMLLSAAAVGVLMNVARNCEAAEQMVSAAGNNSQQAG